MMNLMVVAQKHTSTYTSGKYVVQSYCIFHPASNEVVTACHKQNIKADVFPGNITERNIICRQRSDAL
jgi:hypothetical protein